MTSSFHPEIFIPTNTEFAMMLGSQISINIPRIYVDVLIQTGKIIQYKVRDIGELATRIKDININMPFIIETRYLLDDDLLQEVTDLLIYVEKINDIINIHYFNPLLLISTLFDVDQSDKIINNIVQTLIKSSKIRYNINVNIIRAKHDWMNVGCLLHMLKFYWDVFSGRASIGNTAILQSCPPSSKEMMQYYAKNFYPLLRQYIKDALHGVVENDASTLRIVSNTFYLKKMNRGILTSPFSKKLQLRLSHFISENQSFNILEQEKNTKSKECIVVNRTSGEILAHAVSHQIQSTSNAVILEIKSKDVNDGFIVGKFLLDQLSSNNIKFAYIFVNPANTMFSHMGFQWLDENDKNIKVIIAKSTGKFIQNTEYPQYINFNGKNYGVMMIKL